MVKIITDSTCDLTKEEQRALALTVVPLTEALPVALDVTDVPENVTVQV